jgi:hypothetical protein
MARPPVAAFNRYAAAATLKPRTIKRWKPVVDNLIEHLGHDDLARLTKGDVVAWRKSRTKRSPTSFATGYGTWTSITKSGRTTAGAIVGRRNLGISRCTPTFRISSPATEGGSVSKKYGPRWVKTFAKQIAKLPRYQIPAVEKATQGDGPPLDVDGRGRRDGAVGCGLSGRPAPARHRRPPAARPG